MAVQVSYPGVYIEEFTPAAPIEGVGTSTAAFIGIAASGEIGLPVKLTSFDRFKQIYGELPVSGYYLWYAVKGFFENGGQVCYVVRVSNAKYATAGAQDGSNTLVFNILARNAGELEYNVAIASDSAVTAAEPAVASGTVKTITGRAVDLTNAGEAAGFAPGDIVSIVSGPSAAAVLSVSGSTLRLSEDVPAAALNKAITIAPLGVGTKTMRIDPATYPLPDGALAAGTVLQFTKGSDKDAQIVDSADAHPQTKTYRVRLRTGLTKTFPASNATKIASLEFKLTVTVGGTPVVYDKLALDPAHPRYYVDAINRTGGPVTVAPLLPPPATRLPDAVPAKTSAAKIGGGDDEDLPNIDNTHFADALNALRNIDDVNMVAVPDAVRLKDDKFTAVQQDVIGHCLLMGDRVAVLDTKAGLDANGAEAVAPSLENTRGFAALYYPWLRTMPATAGPPILVPPSGHICGIYARSDTTRGVHKAPANEIVGGAIGTEIVLGDIDHGQLNRKGVNVIRVFQGGGRPVVYGARTTSSDTNWRYVNIRRLFLYLEESIQEGIRWAVFEPNEPGLWAKLRRSISDFLTRAWRDGALFGATPKEAFYVRIDEVLNPDADRALGRLTIEIGIRPSYPAEFIIVRIGIWQAGSEVSEG
ncbi:phage tail sheath subtilisin-like domain-containing protein [Microvirga massiliensis]|uniref:phage tail sheath subtilisin-like domain-containing protein n=1 Tax=Microvirga massiliensis TaxID=1033741 RepID=UPI00062B652A|nr:phage tail sheath subtilisin-like domain-containing protein [Microvirga massiliensis]